MAFENVTKEELIQGMTDARAKDIIMLIKLLVSQVGKERTKELIRKARWDLRYEAGRKAAEKLGNPRGLGSFLEAYFSQEQAIKVPWIQRKWIEKSETRAVLHIMSHCIGKALAELGDEETREIGKEAYCVHDIAWAAGFNPEIKMNITKIPFDGYDYCEFVMEE